MIISHKYEFIFVKTFKTAGSSFEAAFSWVAGPRDVLTPDEPNDQHNTEAFRNYQQLGYFNHMHAVDIKDRVPSDIWSSYFKFCFERNPWDKAISWYYWNLHSGAIPEHTTLSDYVMHHLNKPDWPMYTDRDSILLDYFGKFEDLPGTIEMLKNHLGLPDNFVLPHVKGGSRPPNTHYYELLDEPSRKKIEQVFAETIKLLGYEF